MKGTMKLKLAADDERNNRAIDSAWEMVDLLDILTAVDRASCSFCDEQSWRGKQHASTCPIGRGQEVVKYVMLGG